LTYSKKDYIDSSCAKVLTCHDLVN